MFEASESNVSPIVNQTKDGSEMKIRSGKKCQKNGKKCYGALIKENK